MVAFIGDIVEQVPCVSQSELNSEVDQIFIDNSSIQGIVVVNNEVPISLISRSHFYQKIGTQYGYHLYMGKSVELIIAHLDSLIVDYYQPVTEVSKLAMAREEQNRYDYVIVTKENKYIGVVSIERLLMKLVEVQVEFASFLNPLTGLPGNHIIEAKLKEMIQEERFSILYFDLDHFKAYNDTYGFQKGDQLLESTAELLKKHYTNKGYFLGHIGGDDFIAMIHHHEIQSECNLLIEEFEKMIKEFYTPSHLLQQYVIAENRQGLIEKVPLVSLSIAIVTNQNRVFHNVEELVEDVAAIKKTCKNVPGSCYVTNR
ncbi:GGDEF domain-containing protein [Neobacillus mesonae]|uniref:GGDEF domain-containing protein n=1 Tax=Neobacillus mesonae TaxID=1193713 RepID=UPI00203F8AC5|nr:GGDEF domain-containing protein [Neobacillus mesonae]MCM3570907.1 GGDEF domain-containing protein [Neobacillus mesonae]